MDDQTKKLLKECNVGCKMALQSMTQVEDYLEDSELEQAVEDYRREHERVEKETSRLLMEAGVSEKDQVLWHLHLHGLQQRCGL